MAKKRKNKTTFLILIGVILLGLLASLPSYLRGTPTAQKDPAIQQDTASADFMVHFIDVGQGDCTLISANGHHMLIDGGERGNEERVIKYLKDQGVERFDIVIATHPHSDHMGGLAYGILEAFPVGTVIAPRHSPENTPTTQTYEQFLQVVSKLKQQGATAIYAQPGAEYPLGQAVCAILGPLQEDGSNHNNDSVITRVTYGDIAVLLTGDAEKKVESELAGHWGTTLRSNLLKAGHHGSKTSSNKAFLDIVVPQTLIISCGVGNSYGHPTPEVLQLSKAMGIVIYRTDIDGTVVFGSGGKSIWRVTS